MVATGGGPRKFKMKEGKQRRRHKGVWNPNPDGRPLELTEDFIERYCALVRKVVYLETAANYVGLDRLTLRRWARIGRTTVDKLRSNPKLVSTLTKEEYLMVKFYLATKRAVAESEIDRLTIINKASKKVWTAAAWVLERTRPHKYGNQSREIRDLQREMKELLKVLANNQRGVAS